MNYPRCATCKHAASKPKYSGEETPESLTLLCTAVGGDDGYHGGAEFTAKPDTLALVEGSEWQRLAVSPDFGCVMHEVKG